MQTEELYRIFLEHPNIVTDSRNVSPGCLFFGLKGEQFNGGLFAAEALGKGAAAAIVDTPEAGTGDRIIRVPDTLVTLQQLAIRHRSAITATVIGITGSNGKTTTKELIGRALAGTFKTQTTQGNLNNHIGVPLTLLSIRPETEFAVIEMGANHPGEIYELCKIARPQYGLITNIGKAHLEGFGGFQGVVLAKSELYRFLGGNQGTLFVNDDDPLLVSLAGNLRQVRYGTGTESRCRGRLTGTEPALSLEWAWDNLHGSLETQLYGVYNFENVLAAICIGLFFDAKPDLLTQAIGSYVPSNNRSQWITAGSNKVLLDAYNANPTSMAAALKDFSRISAEKQVVVLGDMMELGEFSNEEHTEIVRLARSLRFDQVVLVGEQFCKAAGDGPEACFEELNEAEAFIRKNPLHHAHILLKGSRKMQLEQLLPCFQ